MSSADRSSVPFHDRPFCRRRLPRAGIEPIDRPDLALAVVAAALHQPPRHETVVIALDERRRGCGLVVVSDTERPDSVCDVVECITRAFDGEPGALIVASIRPGRPHDAGDAGRWHTLSQVAADAGLTLVEWFVIDHDVSCPREVTGDAPRW